MMIAGPIIPNHVAACVFIFLIIPIDVRATCDMNRTMEIAQCMGHFQQDPVWTDMTSQATPNNTKNVGMGMLDSLRGQLNALCTGGDGRSNPLVVALTCLDTFIDECANMIAGLGVEAAAGFDMFKYLFNIKGFVAGIQKMCTDKQIYIDNEICMTSKDAIVGQCLSTKLQASTMSMDLMSQNMADVKWSMCRIYDATFSCYDSLATCSQALAKSTQAVFRLMTPEHCKPNYKNTARISVGVYGDPHLRTALQVWETCSAVGEQTYFKNNAFEIKGTNAEVQGASGSPPPTTLQSITVTFYPIDGNDEDTAIGSYMASSGNVPSTFQSGTANIGSGTHAVTIEEISAGSVVKIKYPAIGMILFIRKGGMNYAITLRMAETVIKEGQGLLATGCPLDQKIDRASVLARRKRAATNQATTACASVSDANMRNTCEYDVTTTSDTEFANTAKGALTDTSSAEGSDTEMVQNANDLSASIAQILADSNNSGAGDAKPQQVITILCISLTFLIRLNNL